MQLSRRHFLLLISATVGSWFWAGRSLSTNGPATDRFKEYVHAVASGQGFLPWQEHVVSPEEQRFRAEVEARKTLLLEEARAKSRGLMYGDEDFEEIKRTVLSTRSGEKWFEGVKARADYLEAQASDYVADMIPELTPTHGYGWTCPHCVGTQSQEGHGKVDWNFKEPDMLRCRFCGQTYPSPDYPETVRLVCPRRNQTFTFYLNDVERRHPHDRTGRYAYKWLEKWPLHMSFSGLIRARKIGYMLAGVKDLAVTCRITGQCRYGVRAREILLRLAACYPNYLYHDYWDTFADCDPLYAAWHDKKLPLPFKRHLCTDAYRIDTLQQAAMLQTYWGAGRIWPSTDSIEQLAVISQAYDLIGACRNLDGEALLQDKDRDKIEKDLMLEYLITAEPWLGGPGSADNLSNKAPGAYLSMAAVGAALQNPVFADTALQGYAGILQNAFLPDGFSRQSPGYTNMYLTNLSRIPGILVASRLLDDAEKGQLTEANERLQLAHRALLDQLRPNGSFFPLADTQIGRGPSPIIVRAASRSKTTIPSGVAGSPAFSLLSDMGMPQAYLETPISVPTKRGAGSPEIYFPSWMTAILRHQGPMGNSALTLTFSPFGSHRHRDNLALFYEDRGDILLGDHGYFGSSPLKRWMESTLSHNLVIVDNQEQEFKNRRPSLHRVLTSPTVSVAEASSRVYSQCREYRRLVALFKGPGGGTFVVDIFRVKGGHSHDYRIFSEIASSDDAYGSMVFSGLDLQEWGPLAKGSASLAEGEIFGLKAPRTSKNLPAAWQAVWKGTHRAYRLWFLTQVDEVSVSNGPGQETKAQVGRRVRYLDAIRRGKDLKSTFIAVHEPLDQYHSGPIEAIETFNAPEAGSHGLALQIRTRWGIYYLVNQFERETEIGRIRFQGNLAILCEANDRKTWGLASEATMLQYGPLGFKDQHPVWSSPVMAHTQKSVTLKTPMPAGWQTLPPGCQNYARFIDGEFQTGYPVSSMAEHQINLARFSLTAPKHCSAPFMYYHTVLSG